MMADHIFRGGARGYWSGLLEPATVDWCEMNYALCSFIAEFFNTFSSLAIVFAGAIGLILNRTNPLREHRFDVAYVAVIVVGIGSVAFHATLLRPMQMLDEVPMLYSAQAMVYCLLENDTVAPRYGRWLPAGLVVHAVLITGLVTLSDGRLQFVLFHLSFGTIEFCARCRIQNSAPPRQHCEDYGCSRV